MMGMRSQLENLSKDELIDEILSLKSFKNGINLKFSELNDRFNDFEVKYEMVNSNLSISRCCNEPLLERINQLELNKLKNIKCNKRNSVKLTRCHLILLIKSWNNLCAKRYHLQGYP